MRGALTCLERVSKAPSISTHVLSVPLPAPSLPPPNAPHPCSPSLPPPAPASAPALQVRASATYIPEMSLQEAPQQHTFAYSIRIKLLPEDQQLAAWLESAGKARALSSCQLLARHWVVLDADMRPQPDREVRGECRLGMALGSGMAVPVTSSSFPHRQLHLQAHFLPIKLAASLPVDQRARVQLRQHNPITAN